MSIKHQVVIIGGGCYSGYKLDEYYQNTSNQGIMAIIEDL